MSEPMAERDDPTGAASELHWEPSYDRVSVERFLEAAAARREELQAQLGEAQARVARARAELHQRDVTRSAELAALVAESHRQLALLEADHEAAVEATRTAALEEVQRIRGAAAGASGGGEEA